MSAKSRVRHALRLVFVSSVLVSGLSPAPSRAEDGNILQIPLPPIEYASLPSNDRLDEPSTTGSLPNTSRVGAGSLSGFNSQVAQGAITLRAEAPTNCLPDNLREVVADVAGKFGSISVESTHRSQGHNRRAGGASHSMHLSCRAIDFRLHSRTRGVMAYLLSRSDVGGLKIYRNGIIHIDNGSRRSW